MFLKTLHNATMAALILSLAMVSGCEPGAAPEPPDTLRLKTSLSAETLRVGDRLKLEMYIRHPPQSQIQWPQPPDPPDWQLLDSSADSRELRDGDILSRLQWELAPFATGAMQVAAGEVVCRKNGEILARRELPDLKVQVTGFTLAAGEGLRPVKGLLEWPAGFIAGHWIIVAAAVLTAALLALHGLRKRRLAQPPPEPPPLPHETALRALQRLSRRGWIEAGRYEPFYVELSSIVRRYLEDRYGLRAPEQTTEEFIAEAASSNLLEPDHRRLTSAFLEQCDLVKFARHAPARADMKDAHGAAEKLVRETTAVAEDAG